MVVKTALLLGVSLTVAAWVYVVPMTPEATQMSMNSSIETYRKMGLLPAAGTTVLSEAIGHGVFEVPASDAVQLKMATMNMDMDSSGMGSMDMGGMNMSSDSSAGDTAMPGMNMDAMPEEAEHGEPGEAMNMDSEPADAEHGEESMAGMNEEAEHGEEEEAEAGHAGGDGLTIVSDMGVMVDKTIQVGMDDWGYDIQHAMVEKGQTVKLVITNNGNTPHEFMIMSMNGMEGVNYRLQRADWNLMEHEALFEVPIMMPGDSVEAVMKIEDSGMWMFMCMFPYHMQMGMMTMMMTPDRMGMTGSMNM